MSMLIVALHVAVSVFLIFVILLQPGKGDGMAALGGGGNASSVFGGRGSVTFLAKVAPAPAAGGTAPAVPGNVPATPEKPPAETPAPAKK